MLMGVLRYEWIEHAVWLSRELLIEMEVATLYCFVCGNSIQIGAVDDSEASFFPHVKDYSPMKTCIGGKLKDPKKAIQKPFCALLTFGLLKKGGYIYMAEGSVHLHHHVLMKTFYQFVILHA